MIVHKGFPELKFEKSQSLSVQKRAPISMIPKNMLSPHPAKSGGRSSC